MRSWILQPGTLITHSAAVRYAAVTFLGFVAVFAALLAMFYTTASDALGMSSSCRPLAWMTSTIFWLDSKLTAFSIPEAQIQRGTEQSFVRQSHGTIRQ